jgi:hypothetical protein
MVLADSHEISRASRYSGSHTYEDTQVSPTGLSPTTATHPRAFDYPHALSLHTQTAAQVRHTPHNPTHALARRRIHARAWFSLIPFRSPLLRESHLFSLPTGTEMFHFPALPSTTLYIQAVMTPHNECRVTPFGNPRINARLPTPRGISQAPTSFIGSWYQGIHRMPYKT